MPSKLRKQTSKRSVRKSTSKPAGKPQSRKASSTSAVQRVLDTAVRKREPLAANTSAFKPPARIPAKLAQLTTGARKKLVARLIQRPEPAPSADVAKAVRALEPPVRRFHGTKVPPHWF